MEKAVYFNEDKIMNHKDWNPALDNFRLGTANGKKIKKYLDICFDHQVSISKDLKVPLYDVGCLIRSNA